MDSEMQSVCSTANQSVLRDDLMKFNLEDFEKDFSTKAPLTNKKRRKNNVQQLARF